MVGEGLYPVEVEDFGYALHLFAAETVDDAALAGVVAYEADYVALGIPFVAHFVVQVGAVERRLEHLCIDHPEVFLYV